MLSCYVGSILFNLSAASFVYFPALFISPLPGGLLRKRHFHGVDAFLPGLYFRGSLGAIFFQAQLSVPSFFIHDNTSSPFYYSGHL